MNNALGIRVLLALGMLLVMATASVDTPASVSAHGGDTTLVHLCVNDANAETLTVFPLPIGNANIDCVNPPWPLGPGWSPVDVGTILGVTAGTGLTGGGSTGTVNLNADTAFLQRRVNGSCLLGTSIRIIDQNGTVTCEADDVGIGGSGTVGKIAKFTGPTDIGDSVITESAGNVGIGVEVPNERLEIGGNFRLPSTTATEGIIMSGGNRFIHNFGSSNFFAGVNAGNLTMTGAGFNSGIGVSALQSNTTGNSNTAVGVDSLLSNTTGSSNTATGTNSLVSNTGGSANTASGTSSMIQNTTGRDNTAAGVDSLFFNTTGSFNTAAGKLALRTNTIGTNNTAIGYFADVSSAGLTNATAIGANTKVNASNKIRLGNSAVTVIEGQVAFTFPSDVNQKENFLAVDGEATLEKISQMNLESWNYKGHDPSQFRHYGPTAQEFFAAFGDDGFGTVGTDTTINSGDMAGIMMIAIQALEQRTAQVTQLEQLVAKQQAQMQGMEERLKALEAR